MKKEGCSSIGSDASYARFTRARAAACRANGKSVPLLPPVSNPERKQGEQGRTKRTANDENGLLAPFPAASQCKKRAVLKDVTNMRSQNTSKKWIPAGKLQVY